MIPVAIGLVAGVLGGLVGVGGGVLMVPLLTGWARLDQHAAHGTSLAGVVVTGLAGTGTYAAHGDVSWRAALWLTLASVVASYYAARYSRRISPSTLRRAFALFLLLTAVLLPLKGHIGFGEHGAGAWLVPVLLASGLLVGVVTGLLGIGGGSLIVPLLVLAGGLGQHLAQGTSLAAMVPAGISGSIAHVRYRRVAFDVLPGLAAGIVLGTWLGGRAALALPGATLRGIFAVVLVALGIYYFRGARPAPTVEEMPESTPKAA